MSIVDNQYRTISCNGCDKTVTFEQSQQGILREVLDANPWLKTTRIVQPLAGGRNFVYCGDECELSNVAAGAHNPEEPKKVIASPGGNVAIAQAAAAARQAEEATKAIKSGASVTLHGG